MYKCEPCSTIHFKNFTLLHVFGFFNVYVTEWFLATGLWWIRAWNIFMFWSDFSYFIDYFNPSRSMMYCNHRVYLSVCLSVHLHFLKNFLYTLPRLFFDDTVLRFCISTFVDGVIFSHNGANGPESNTMLMFHLVRHLAALGTKSAIFNCTLFYIVVPCSRLSWLSIGFSVCNSFDIVSLHSTV